MTYTFTRHSSGQIISPNDINELQAAIETVTIAVFNVREPKYGAKGDGVANDAPSIQAAIKDAQEGGGVVYLPKGTYNLAASLSIIASNIVLVGQGSASVLRAAAGSETIPLLQIIGSSEANVAHVAIRDLLFDSQNQKTANPAIKLVYCFRTWLERLRFERQYRAVYIRNSTETWFRDSDIDNTSEHGIVWENDHSKGFDLYLQHIIMNNPTVASSGAGLYWNGGEGLLATNCDIMHFTNGVLVSPDVGRQCRFGFLTGVQADTCSDNGWKFTNAGGGDVVAITLENCWASTATNHGVLVEKPGASVVQGIRWIGGKVFHNGRAGFQLAGGADAHISACDIAGNSQTTNGLYHGIEVAAGVSDWSVCDCRIGGNFQQGNTQGCAIFVNPGGSDHFVIEGNDVRGNLNTSLISNRAIGTHRIVRNNLGYTTEANGTVTAMAGATSATVNHGLSIMPGLQDIAVTPTSAWNGMTGYWVSNPTNSSFTINIAGTTTAAVAFAWRTVVL